MNRPIESDYTSQVAYTRALEAYCDGLPQLTQQEPWCMKMNGCKTKCEDCPVEVQPAQQEPVLQEIEQYRLQMAGISTAAIGYWKESDGIHPDYDTPALRDVAKLYAKYDELYRAQPAQRKPLTVVEIMREWNSANNSVVNFVRAIEAAYGIKEST